MEAFLSGVAAGLNILMTYDIFGVPILLWFIIAASFTLIGKFIVGKK